MIEVESKIEVSNPERYRKLIQKIARYKRTKRKVDDYYTLESLKDYPKKTIRIRQLDGHYEVNIKKSLSYIKGVHAKNEVELMSKEKDLELFKEIIEDLGFRRWLRKEKTSEIYEIKKNFTIELNKVKQLGWFIEVEYLAERNEIERARAEVLKVVKKLGAKESDIIKDGYTKMMWKKKIRGF